MNKNRNWVLVIGALAIVALLVLPSLVQRAPAQSRVALPTPSLALSTMDNTVYGYIYYLDDSILVRNPLCDEKPEECKGFIAAVVANGNLVGTESVPGLLNVSGDGGEDYNRQHTFLELTVTPYPPATLTAFFATEAAVTPYLTPIHFCLESAEEPYYCLAPVDVRITGEHINPDLGLNVRCAASVYNDCVIFYAQVHCDFANTSHCTRYPVTVYEIKYKDNPVFKTADRGWWGAVICRPEECVSNYWIFLGRELDDGSYQWFTDWRPEG